MQENQEQKISAILNLSNVYQSSSKSNLAINLLEQTIETERLTNIQKGNLLNNLGANYLITKSYDKAKKVLEYSIKLLKDNKYESEKLSKAIFGFESLRKISACKSKASSKTVSA